MSGDTVFTLAPGLDILEILELSLIKFIYFGCSVLILLSDKMSDEIDLCLFSFFTVSSVSIILETLDLSNDIPLFYSLPIDLFFYFEMLVVCLFCL